MSRRDYIILEPLYKHYGWDLFRCYKICRQQTSASAILLRGLLAGAFATKSYPSTTSTSASATLRRAHSWRVVTYGGCTRHQIICVGAVYRCMSVLKQVVYCLQYFTHGGGCLVLRLLMVEAIWCSDEQFTHGVGGTTCCRCVNNTNICKVKCCPCSGCRRTARFIS